MKIENKTYVTPPCPSFAFVCFVLPSGGGGRAFFFKRREGRHFLDGGILWRKDTGNRSKKIEDTRKTKKGSREETEDRRGRRGDGRWKIDHRRRRKMRADRR